MNGNSTYKVLYSVRLYVRGEKHPRLSEIYLFARTFIERLQDSVDCVVVPDVCICKQGKIISKKEVGYLWDGPTNTDGKPLLFM